MMERDDLFQTLIDIAALILVGIIVVGTLGFAAYTVFAVFDLFCRRTINTTPVAVALEAAVETIKSAGAKQLRDAIEHTRKLDATGNPNTSSTQS